MTNKMFNLLIGDDAFVDEGLVYSALTGLFNGVRHKPRKTKVKLVREFCYFITTDVSFSDYGVISVTPVTSVDDFVIEANSRDEEGNRVYQAVATDLDYGEFGGLLGGIDLLEDLDLSDDKPLVAMHFSACNTEIERKLDKLVQKGTIDLIAYPGFHDECHRSKYGVLGCLLGKHYGLHDEHHVGDRIS